METQKHEFEDVKIGDTVYLYPNIPVKVVAINDRGFTIKDKNDDLYATDFDGYLVFAINYRCKLVFWQSVPKIVPPSRPKRMIKKKMWVALYRINHTDKMAVTSPLWKTEAEAKEYVNTFVGDFIKTIPIEWEDEE
jgi:hypothetical protein